MIIAALGAAIFGAPRDAFAEAPVCAMNVATQQVNNLFQVLTPVLNEAWPKVAIDNGLDPWPMVWQGDIKIGCKYGGDEFCGLMLGQCKDFYFHATAQDMTGLSSMQFDAPVEATMSATPGTQACGFTQPGGQAWPSYTNTCSYHGAANTMAQLLQPLVVSLEGMAVKAKCTSINGTKTYTVWQSHARCSVNDLSGAATMNQCSGTCASAAPGVALEGLQLGHLHFAAKNVTCDLSSSIPSGYGYIVNLVVPALKNQLVAAITPPIKKAVNGLIPPYVPFPGTCN